MWMKETRETRVSTTVFHKHKYISNSAVTPADAVIATAGNLASALKGKMPQYLQESPLVDLTRLSAFFSEAAATPEDPLTEDPPPAAPASQNLPQSVRLSPRLATRVTKDGLISTCPRPPPAPPVNPPILPPRCALKACVSLPPKKFGCTSARS